MHCMQAQHNKPSETPHSEWRIAPQALLGNVALVHPSNCARWFAVAYHTDEPALRVTVTRTRVWRSEQVMQLSSKETEAYPATGPAPRPPRRPTWSPAARPPASRLDARRRCCQAEVAQFVQRRLGRQLPKSR